MMHSAKTPVRVSGPASKPHKRGYKRGHKTPQERRRGVRGQGLEMAASRRHAAGSRLQCQHERGIYAAVKPSQTLPAWHVGTLPLPPVFRCLPASGPEAACFFPPREASFLNLPCSQVRGAGSLTCWFVEVVQVASNVGGVPAVRSPQASSAVTSVQLCCCWRTACFLSEV